MATKIVIVTLTLGLENEPLPTTPLHTAAGLYSLENRQIFLPLPLVSALLCSFLVAVTVSQTTDDVTTATTGHVTVGGGRSGIRRGGTRHRHNSHQLYEVPRNDLGRRPTVVRRRRPGGKQPSTPNNRDGRFLSLFTVVEFENRACMAASGDNGTCLTESECVERGGVVSGPCAHNFGVCCLFMATCGQTTSQNCSYFVNPGYPSFYDGSGSCQLTIQKAHPDICQYRLEFDNFVLSGPETLNHMCNNDQFLVSGGSPVPTICGMNAGNHMYIDAGLGTSPVTLTVVTSGPAMNRHWKIKVCQIPCSSNYKAEDGCLQYFTGVSGQIKSFNYEPMTGLHLSNQDYSICVRMERNFCGIQYTQCPDEVNNRTHSFTLTGNTLGQNSVTSMIGGVGPNSCNTDWLIIPCTSNVGRMITPATPGCVDRLCGGTLNSEVSIMPATVYSTVKPFRLVFHTNNVEAPNDVGNRGFCLDYVQQPCTNAPNSP
ncbi:uncharacterized protein LOC129004772 [Macrosteles quadrilineatus]|uniref:uncharacterized protein LOC129004772 n=1 Tax=Macrosteles quadrilineatus TaxID=74068 RepID=UPI0023E21333|nr:uncharacterized protein LOC129004772 [Macrosteles quadrilineatus]